MADLHAVVQFAVVVVVVSPRRYRQRSWEHAKHGPEAHALNTTHA
jgi:hypothetical protein